MLTFQIEKQRHEKTLIGSLQSKWKKALKKMGKPSLSSLGIALSIIMILAVLLFINMRNTQMPKQRDLKSVHAAGHDSHDRYDDVVPDGYRSDKPLPQSSGAPLQWTNAAAPSPLFPSADAAAQLQPPHGPVFDGGNSTAPGLPHWIPKFNVLFNTTFEWDKDSLSVNWSSFKSDDQRFIAQCWDARLRKKLEEDTFKFINTQEMARKAVASARGGNIWGQSQVKRIIKMKMYDAFQFPRASGFQCTCKGAEYDNRSCIGTFEYECGSHQLQPTTQQHQMMARRSQYQSAGHQQLQQTGQPQQLPSPSPPTTQQYQPHYPQYPMMPQQQLPLLYAAAPPSTAGTPLSATMMPGQPHVNAAAGSPPNSAATALAVPSPINELLWQQQIMVKSMPQGSISCRDLHGLKKSASQILQMDQEYAVQWAMLEEYQRRLVSIFKEQFKAAAQQRSVIIFDFKLIPDDNCTEWDVRRMISIDSAKDDGGYFYEYIRLFFSKNALPRTVRQRRRYGEGPKWGDKVEDNLCFWLKQSFGVDCDCKCEPHDDSDSKFKCTARFISIIELLLQQQLVMVRQCKEALQHEPDEDKLELVETFESQISEQLQFDQQTDQHWKILQDRQRDIRNSFEEQFQAAAPKSRIRFDFELISDESCKSCTEWYERRIISNGSATDDGAYFYEYIRLFFSKNALPRKLKKRRRDGVWAKLVANDLHFWLKAIFAVESDCRCVPLDGEESKFQCYATFISNEAPSMVQPPPLPLPDAASPLPLPTSSLPAAAFPPPPHVKAQTSFPPPSRAAPFPGRRSHRVQKQLQLKFKSTPTQMSDRKMQCKLIPIECTENEYLEIQSYFSGITTFQRDSTKLVWARVIQRVLTSVWDTRVQFYRNITCENVKGEDYVWKCDVHYYVFL